MFKQRLLIGCFLLLVMHMSLCTLCVKQVNSIDKRVLVLIIASDDMPVYRELQKIWQSYMHSDPEHITAYFIKGDPAIAYTYLIKDDVIWLRTKESIRPGIINKTLMAMEAFLPQIHQFDYVLRTNLSSFYFFPRLLKFLQNSPTERFLAGRCDGNFVSGSGFILSTDLVGLLVRNKRSLFNSPGYDDVVISGFLHKNGVKFVSHAREDFLSMDDWEKKKQQVPETMFQFRIKTQESSRIRDDIYIQSQLLKMFY